MVHGSASLTYTATLVYKWQPDEGEDLDSDPAPTEPVEFDLGETFGFQFTNNSGAGEWPGAASGNLTVAGVSITKSATCEPDGQGGATWTLNQSGTDGLAAPVMLSGEGGELTRTYSLTWSTDGIIGVTEFHLQSPLAKAKFVWIDSATWTESPMGTANLSVSGRWSRPANDARDFRVRVSIRQPPGGLYGVWKETANLGGSGTWSLSDTKALSGYGSLQLKAELIAWNGSTWVVIGAPDFRVAKKP